MNKAISIGSKYALKVQKEGLDNYLFNDDKYIFYFSIANEKNNSFGINDVVAIEKNKRSYVNEKDTI